MLKNIRNYAANFESHIDYSDLGSVRAFLCVACIVWGVWVIWPGIVLDTLVWHTMMELLGNETVVALFPLSAGALSIVSDLWGLKRVRAYASGLVFMWWFFVLTSAFLGSSKSTAVPIYFVVTIYAAWVVYRDSSLLWLKRPS